MADASRIVTFLFADIEGSTRLWERDDARMREAVAQHHALASTLVARHRGSLDTTTGDGVLALFADPLDALHAAVDLQLGLAGVARATGIELRVRCAIHAGPDERGGNVFFGREANRAARLMAAAHGGQVLLSHAAAELVRPRLPGDASLLDLGNVRLRDLATPEHVHQLAHAGLRREFPPLRGLDRVPHNLPAQLTPLVGRGGTLADLRARLREARLLTLTGAGGIGKTRLALELAGDALERFADGAWLVDLAAVNDPALVAQAVASALGIKEQPGSSLGDAIAEHVRERSLLLLLDNCEHVIQAAAEVAQRVLRAGTAVTVLATSRESLRIAGETLFAVEALPVPGTAAGGDMAAIASFDSVRLFVERGRRTVPGFALSAANAGAVAEICRRLDGMPLALELAAARLSMLAPAAIAERLEDRFALLSRGERTALPRQQSLHALIAWSYDLLSEEERRLFRRLAVFAGSWDLEGAEAIARLEDAPRTDVPDVLGALVDKSLVVADREQGRYRMLETVREFAHSALTAAGERPLAANAHVSYYVALAERARRGFEGAAQGEWMRRIARARASGPQQARPGRRPHAAGSAPSPRWPLRRGAGAIPGGGRRVPAAWRRRRAGARLPEPRDRDDRAGPARRCAPVATRCARARHAVAFHGCRPKRGGRGVGAGGTGGCARRGRAAFGRSRRADRPHRLPARRGRFSVHRARARAGARAAWRRARALRGGGPVAGLRRADEPGGAAGRSSRMTAAIQASTPG
jgi:predicted ATPase/class 3 adenylate cyclase